MATPKQKLWMIFFFFKKNVIGNMENQESCDDLF